MNSAQPGKYTISKAINLKCILADSFPAGISQSHAEIRELCGGNSDVTYYGISHPDNHNGIIYLAGAQENFVAETGKKLVAKTIPTGDYIFMDVADYTNNLMKIGLVFDKLTHYPGIDPNGFCLEWYLPDDICRCMIRLNDRTQ